MSNKDKSLRELMHSKGFLFPRNPDEILSHENNIESEGENPKDWDNPLNIIRRGSILLKDFSLISVPNQELQNLAMAARDGKIISGDVRKKMNEDRKDAKK